MDQATEAHRRACEARHWLREGYTTAASVAQLMTRIEAKRGIVAARELQEEMRLQWKRRHEWMEAHPI